MFVAPYQPGLLFLLREQWVYVAYGDVCSCHWGTLLYSSSVCSLGTPPPDFMVYPFVGIPSNYNSRVCGYVGAFSIVDVLSSPRFAAVSISIASSRDAPPRGCVN